MSDPRTTPTGVKAPHGAREMTLSWADGLTASIPHELLRGYCPCAHCQGHGGTIRFVRGGDLDLREIEQVGNYALCFTWGDGHSTGIYTFRWLRALCERDERGVPTALADDQEAVASQLDDAEEAR